MSEDYEQLCRNALSLHSRLEEAEARVAELEAALGECARAGCPRAADVVQNPGRAEPSDSRAANPDDRREPGGSRSVTPVHATSGDGTPQESHSPAPPGAAVFGASSAAWDAPEAATDRWRTGRSVGRTLYLDDVCVGMVDRPEMAAAIVAAMNAHRTDKASTRRDGIPLCGERTEDGVAECIQVAGHEQRGMAHAFRPRAANARPAEALMTWVRLYALARPKGKHLKRREADLFAACVAAGLVDPEWQEKR